MTMGTNLKADGCQNALTACLEYIKAADSHIKLLEEQGKELVRERDEAIAFAKENVGNSSILPFYAWIGLGFIAGGVAGIGLVK